MNEYPQRGEIWLSRLDPVVGHELGKTRSVIIISNNKNNEFSSTITVLPITSKAEKIYPHETPLMKGEGNLPLNSKVKTDQIRALGKRRIVKFIGKLSEQRIKQVERALLLHLGFY